MTYSYYVYYRVLRERAEHAESCIRQLLALVESKTGVAGRWLTKRGEPDLWMEVYESVTEDAAFERELAQAVGVFRATEFLQAGSDRHIECFEANEPNASSLRAVAERF